MEIRDFLERWREAGGAERANKDLFLAELCDVLGVERPQPATSDPEKDTYVFERPVARSREDGTSIGRIDLYRAGCFVLEAKQPDPAKRGGPAWEQAMHDAYGQALGYARSLPEPPPFVVVCDLGHCLDLYAAFDGSGAYRPFPDGFRKRLWFADLEAHRPQLRAVWLDPLSLDPSRHQARVTREVAAKIAGLARELEGSGHDAGRVAEFLMRCLFTMFAEDVGLLPGKLFTKSLAEYWMPHPEAFPGGIGALWRAMDAGGDTLAGKLLRFNGGLFRSADALPLTPGQMRLLAEAAASDWAAVDPSIFGTLLERALDPAERHRLGAHYTPRAYVERLVRPTIEEPLRADWDLVRAEARQLVEAEEVEAAQARVRDFHRRLCATRVLDPACGTGNFLYVTLDLFLRLESEVLSYLEGLGYAQLGLELASYRVTPEQFRGIEVKRWAKEIAELVLWIGYLQWQVRQTGAAHTIAEPVLRDYGNIECRDAVLAWDGDPEPARDEHGAPVTRWDGVTTKPSPVTGEPIPDETAVIPVFAYRNPRAAEWPRADFIVGNPPYIGNKRMRQALGDGYVEALRAAHDDVPETADLVMYWWNRAASLVAAGEAQRFGLITTNSITQVFNRKVVEKHLGKGELSIVFAIPDHPWVDSVDGAAVRVAMTVVASGAALGKALWVREERLLDDGAMEVLLDSRFGRIGADLSTGPAPSAALRLLANSAMSYMGVILCGEGFFVDVPQASAARAAAEAAGVLAKYLSGTDLTRSVRGREVVDFHGLSEQEALRAAGEAFQWLLERVKPRRVLSARESHRRYWWQFCESRPGMRSALAGLTRYIATARTARHRVFQFVGAGTLVESNVIAVASDDPFLLVALSSRAHLAWSARAGATLEDRPHYTNSTAFDPFPFPTPSPRSLCRLRELGEALDSHRKARQVEHPGLTITGMYNVLEKLRSGEALTPKERTIHEQGLVSVLRQLHDEIDAEVFAAYGWPAGLADEEILERLVALNRERAEEEKRGLVRWLRPDFQNPGGAVAPVQDELPGAATSPAGPASGSGAAAAPRPWPKNVPEQIAALRDLLAEAGHLDLVAARAAFGRAPAAPVRGALDSLVALGLAVRAGEGVAASWSAVRG